ncbi:hypothetical protein [Pontibacter oryzae]|uniref:Uncharacterized protein n=1 Tax=Pontibacter oryzae TaxID=2304593 RepID=A0A399RU39_9BACT|nr:hypothetical protein [Pontibacter oryzae]RIJ33549.1 hypothetical protein D1627_18230 [Pontibacter oryzae]
MDKFRVISFSGFKISLYAGFSGGIVLSLLSHDPFKLYYVGGYLLIITLGLIVFSSILFYKREEIGIRFGEKVQVGLGSYMVSITLSTVYKILKGQFNIENSFGENILLILIHLGFGLFLSTLFSISLKSNISSKNNKP